MARSCLSSHSPIPSLTRRDSRSITEDLSEESSSSSNSTSTRTAAEAAAAVFARSAAAALNESESSVCVDSEMMS